MNVIKKNEYDFVEIETKKLYRTTIILSILYFGLIAKIVIMVFRPFCANLSEMEQSIVLNTICSLLMLIFLLVMNHDFYKKSIEGLLRPGLWNNMKWIIKGMVYYLFFGIAFVFIPALVAFLNGCSLKTQSVNQEYVYSALSTGSIIMIIYTCVLGPFVEESMIRGLIYSSIRKRLNVISALVLSSFLFAFLHMRRELGSFDYSSLIWLMRYMAAGFTFGLLYEKRRNIYLNIFLHMLVNIIATLQIFI